MQLLMCCVVEHFASTLEGYKACFSPDPALAVHMCRVHALLHGVGQADAPVQVCLNAPPAGQVKLQVQRKQMRHRRAVL